jgi:hypothetical protein
MGAALNQRAPPVDRPQVFDRVLADGEEHVVQVDGRVAVAGRDPDLIDEPCRRRQLREGLLQKAARLTTFGLLFRTTS